MAKLPRCKHTEEARTRRRLRWVAAAFACAMLSTLGYHFFVADAAAPDDSDLRIEVTRIADRDNGYATYARALAQRVQPAGVGRIAEVPARYRASGSPIAWAVVSQNLATLSLLDQALAAPRFVLPPVLSHNDPIPSLFDLRDATGLLQLRGDLGGGASWRAAEDYLAMIQLGHSFMGDNAVLHSFHCGAASKSLGLMSLADLLARRGLSDEELARLAQRLHEIRYTRNQIEEVIRRDYDGNSKLLDVAAELSWWDRASFSAGFLKVNTTRRRMAGLYRIALQDAGRSKSQEKWLEEIDVLREKARWIEFLAGNSGGENIVRNLLPYLLASHYGLLARERRLFTLVALLRFEATKGRRAATLDELVPEFLVEVPRDPYDGAPIRYDASAGIIYTVGEDYIDDGASEAPQDQTPVWQPVEALAPTPPPWRWP